MRGSSILSYSVLLSAALLFQPAHTLTISDLDAKGDTRYIGSCYSAQLSCSTVPAEWSALPSRLDGLFG